MTDTPPPPHVMYEARRLSGMSTTTTLEKLTEYYKAGGANSFRALCDMIAKGEFACTEPMLLCARAAYAHVTGYGRNSKQFSEIIEGRHDDLFESEFELAIRAIKLWEEGFGRPSD